MIKYGGLLLVVFFCLISARPLAPTKKIRKVVIDPGHGGKDPGCLGKISKEKDIALAVALELGALIKELQPDVEVIYTRKTDVFVELSERARIANKEMADLFISIHCNANRMNSVVGTETYVLGVESNDANLEVAKRENSVIFEEENYKQTYRGFNPNSPASYILLANYQYAHRNNSLNFAAKIEKQFAEKQQRKSRGVKQSGFLVLARTAMPGVLVEIGFLTNEEDERYLNSEIGKAFTAASIYRAFRDYKYEIEKK
ncbi:MAG: N-acetylmuramoyl-L-alanine amidase [Cytophagales bacterium]|nr:N-acetylmuramoyl-L-alanine amidase [Cytophagales bacterium]MDW8385100.1 N-acetylmuramoyl-L-alanine amidase [Flammeovirgaceae bacterium]